MSDWEISITEDSEKDEHSNMSKYDSEKMGTSPPEITTDLVS